MTPFTLEQVLRKRRDEIIARFVTEVLRKDLPPADLAPSLLVDHIPTFLDEILRELGQQREPRTSYDAFHTSPTARRHGGQRWSVGYDLEALIREYGILRHCILEEAKRAGARISIDEFDVLAKCLNVGATEAAAAYVRHRDDELAFLTEAGELLSSSLDRMSILSRLARVVVPRFADWCTVHVVGDDDTSVSHLDPTKVPALRELHARWSSSIESGGAYFRALNNGRPELVEAANEEALQSLAPSPVEADLLREVSAQSWAIVPIRLKSDQMAAMVLAYGVSGRRYTRSDLPIFVELAEKASVALQNAHLYDLSQQARTRVEAATRAKDEFVAMVSHELRTPLNSILGWLRLYRSGVLAPEKQEHAFDVVERNANSLNSLVADLLDVSRILTGSLHLDPSLVDLASTVEQVVDGFRPTLEAKRITVSMILGKGKAFLRGDERRLQQVVSNLLSNAIKFTPTDGRIEVTIEQMESNVELRVSDNGSGISPDFLPHVFDSFRQSESGATRRHGGLGIGLSIAQHIVELHGGSISAFSEGSGTGSSFTVRLPVGSTSTTNDGAPEPAAARTELVSIPGGLEGLRVLVVDDDEDARDLLRVLLETAGCDVRTSSNADQGTVALEDFHPDVLVCDVAMPGEDGYSLIRRIRTLPSKAAKTPALALTAYARNEDRSRALVEGFNAHLRKPVEPAELLTVVADLAGRPRTPSSPS